MNNYTSGHKSTGTSLMEGGKSPSFTHYAGNNFNGEIFGKVSRLEERVNSLSFSLYSSRDSCSLCWHKFWDQDLWNTKCDHIDYIHDDNNFHQLFGSLCYFIQSYIYTYLVYTLKVYMYLRSIYCMNQTTIPQEILDEQVFEEIADKLSVEMQAMEEFDMEEIN